MRSEIRGSHRPPPEGARALGPLPDDERVEVSVHLRPRSGQSPVDALRMGVEREGGRLSREEFASLHGAAPDDVAKVEEFAREHGLEVLESDPARRVVVLAGPAAAMSAAFDVELQRYERDGQVFRGRVGAVRVPTDVAEVVEGVFGLDERPQARPHVRMAAVPLAVTPFTPPQVAGLYDFPTAGSGAGQTIGIIELGGGYLQSDLTTYFAQLGLRPPQVLTVPVDGGTNNPGNDLNADAEVALDIEVAGAVAPDATIVVYFAPNTDRGFLDAVTTAIQDSAHRPSVISISWGGAESTWTLQAMQVMDQAFQAAAALGVTICCASGDAGSGDGVGDGRAHVDFPASSPYALGCGGTRLVAANGGIASEVVWNDAQGATGGGVSDVFDLPGWQIGVGVPASINPGNRVGRGVPDVAGNADPQTGYQVQVRGQLIVVGGTSAVAPLWAGLFALINEQLNEPAGYVTPLLYQELRAETDVVRDVTSGTNGGYPATPGWDACTGLGTPGGEDWLAALIY